MNQTIRIQINDPRAYSLLENLASLNLIKLIEDVTAKKNERMSDRFKGVFTTEDAQSFNTHSQQMREEWDNT